MSNVDTKKVCIILAGGQGKRMRSRKLHKVCFPVAGQAAIVRTVGTFKASGVGRFIVVVGTMADQVISTLSAAHPDVLYVWQQTPMGTGHAVSCALGALKAEGYDGEIIVTMGDKVVSHSAIERLIKTHESQHAEITVSSLLKTPESSAGRIVLDGGKPLGIVEVKDIQRAAENRRKIKVGGKPLTAKQIEKASKEVNASLYMFNSRTLFDSVAELKSDNAQGELYLTDTLEWAVAHSKKIAIMCIEDHEDLMTFNTPEELLKIEEVFARRNSSRKKISAGHALPNKHSFKPAGEWLKIFKSRPAKLMKKLYDIYGKNDAVINERLGFFVDVTKKFIELYSDARPMAIVRAPGRINLMGRHVDHRGGYVNSMAINREVVFATSRREDDVVTLHNLDSKNFPDCNFVISDLLGQADLMDWVDYINSDSIRKLLEASRGDWSNYAKAAVLRLQHACCGKRLSGMDCVVAGDIPMGAGLSSSSSIVVACAEAATSINALDVKPKDFVDLCGEGEWFVGSRGGSADHAAIRSGMRGGLVQVGFFPFRVEKNIKFPDELVVVIANSHLVAKKSEGARDYFNHRVTAYNIAEMLLKKRSKLLRDIEHLRDINPISLGVGEDEIYSALKLIPQKITRKSALNLLPENRQKLITMFASHKDVGPYPLRDVVMYGISECLRSEMFASCLESGDFNKIGTLMKVSHDGDRVVTYKDGWASVFEPDYSDKSLNSLIKSVNSTNDTMRASAELWRQPGRYACSKPEIDYIVDLACSQQGVIGAQLAGAGLGGCAMILVKRDNAKSLLKTLDEKYYKPRRLKFDVHVCQPVAGSGLLEL